MMMNERIAALYDQSLVIHGNGDYVAGELDVEKFAELIVLECAQFVGDPNSIKLKQMKRHFGVE